MFSNCRPTYNISQLIQKTVYLNKCFHHVESDNYLVYLYQLLRSNFKSLKSKKFKCTVIVINNNVKMYAIVL